VRKVVPEARCRLGRGTRLKAMEAQGRRQKEVSEKGGGSFPASVAHMGEKTDEMEKKGGKLDSRDQARVEISGSKEEEPKVFSRKGTG